jgi:hypothetical protein
MDDHFFGRTEGMRMQQSDAITIVSQGEVSHMTGKASGDGLERIMSNRDYTIYDDLIRPNVSISNDGTMAWVIVQIRAEGVRYDDFGEMTGPLDFVCAWIELYKKEGGQWKMTGNVSNFHPDDK